MTDIYSIPVKTIGGQEETLKQYKGKVLLVVNVASGCGFTPQYEGLEELYKTLKEKGLVILGFPCNQFGSQEPGSEKEIQTFCQTRYDVTFPMFAKIDVNGEHTHPLYALLKSSQTGLFGSEAIKWNFTKFLIDRNGKVIARFAPQTAPEKLRPDIEKLL
ncbi:MAG: glutathione peroxidase [Bdellovibrionales bacterium GWA2_49_15]|nr:MAG: glutathione peroxidase [Bdellovibrionales bacterium GWA2_49_15]HAZ11941.1 glutathione peroxidase [Bdellovibrionales bacterium]